MSMHIIGPHLTTTSYKKREQKITKAKQEELENDWRARNIRLREMGLPKETFEQFLEWIYGRGKKEKKTQSYQPNLSTAAAEKNIKEQLAVRSNISRVVSPDISNPPGYVGASMAVFDSGGCTKKPAPVYTGSKIVGIATMHKSNMVPVFSSEEAEDISKMRRG